MAYCAVKRRIHLVAEGIETAAELKTLRTLGIGYGQGYLLGRPQDGRGPGPWPTVVALAKPETRHGGQRRPRPTPKPPAASSPRGTI
jgi:EAL domain-containing protein (putative c-di-GMP-specific phosphodiesterase class I)